VITQGKVIRQGKTWFECVLRSLLDIGESSLRRQDNDNGKTMTTTMTNAMTKAMTKAMVMAMAMAMTIAMILTMGQ
jgi:hypothetical protein